MCRFLSRTYVFHVVHLSCGEYGVNKNFMLHRTLFRLLAIRCNRVVLEGNSISAVARTFNVHPATIYRCIEPNGSL